MSHNSINSLTMFFFLQMRNIYDCFLPTTRVMSLHELLFTALIIRLPSSQNTYQSEFNCSGKI